MRYLAHGLINDSIDIIRSNQKYSGLKDYPEIQKSLREVGKSLVELSKNEKMSLGNLLASITTNQSIINIHVNKLREEYRIEDKENKFVVSGPVLRLASLQGDL